MKRNKRSKAGRIAGTVTTTLLAASIVGCAVEDTAFRSKSTTRIGGTGHWQTLFVEGKEDLHENRLGLAIDKLQAALAKRPKSIEVINAVGVAYDRLGRHELGEMYFERALALAPNSLQTLNNLGYSLSQQGRHEEAVTYLQRAALRTSEASVSAVVSRNYRVAMNKLRVASARRKSPMARQASLAANADCTANAIWIERTTTRVHTLITKPSPAARVALAKLSGAQRDHNTKRACLAALRDTLIVLPPISEITEPMQVSVVQKDAPAHVARTPLKEASKDLKRANTGNGPVIEVSNGAGRNKLAARMRRYIEATGQRVGRLTNDSNFGRDKTIIFYRKGHTGTAKRLADLLPIPVKLLEATGQTVDIRVRLGSDVLDFDRNVLMKEHKV
jgi:Tfp pilus assembly protein PilF